MAPKDLGADVALSDLNAKHLADDASRVQGKSRKQVHSEGEADPARLGVNICRKVFEQSRVFLLERKGQAVIDQNTLRGDSGAGGSSREYVSAIDEIAESDGMSLLDDVVRYGSTSPNGVGCDDEIMSFRSNERDSPAAAVGKGDVDAPQRS